MQFLDLTILSFIFEIMLYNATNIKTIFDKKKTLEGLLIKKSKIIVSNYRAFSLTLSMLMNKSPETLSPSQ